MRTAYYSTRYPIPTEVLDLNEDILALERCKELLDRITERNVADDSQEGYKRLRMARAQVNTMYRHAWDKMRQEYLAPQRKKIERPKKSAVKLRTNEQQHDREQTS